MDNSEQEDISYDETIVSQTSNSLGTVMISNEKLIKQNKALEAEIQHLTKNYSALKDSIKIFADKHDKDVFAEMSLNLSRANEQIEYWHNEYASSNRKFADLHHSTTQEMKEYDNKVKDLTRMNLKLESENLKLKKQIDDDRSLIFKLENDKNVPQEFFLQKENKDQQVGPDDIRKEIIAALSEHGMETDNDKIISITKMLQDIVEKRRRLIKEENEKLLVEYRGRDPKFDGYLQELDEDSLNVSQSIAESHARSNDAIFSKSVRLPLTDISNADETRGNIQDHVEMAANTMSRAANLADLCKELFEKLRNTAEFFNNLLGQLGVDAGDVLEKIGELYIDLDKSMVEAASIRDEAKTAERSIRQFLDRSCNVSLAYLEEFNESKISITQEDVDILTCPERQHPLQSVAPKCAFCDSLKQTLNSELANKQALVKEVADLRIAMDGMVPDKEKLVCGLRNELEKICDTLTSAQSKLETTNKQREQQKKKQSLKEKPKETNPKDKTEI